MTEFVTLCMFCVSQELVHQILLPPTQVHPSTHIQIVLPGAHGQVSSHAVSLPATQQQVLLQVS